MKALNVTAGEYARLQVLGTSSSPIVEGHPVPVSSLLSISRSLGVPVYDLHDDALVLRVRRDVIAIDQRITEWGR